MKKRLDRRRRRCYNGSAIRGKVKILIGGSQSASAKSARIRHGTEIRFRTDTDGQSPDESIDIAKSFTSPRTVTQGRFFVIEIPRKHIFTELFCVPNGGILMKNQKIRNIAVTAVMAAVSTVLMFLSFSVPLVPSFLKFDFSELPALLTGFALGPVYGVAVCLVKNVVNVFFTTTFGVGELSNFILGCMFVVPAALIYRHKKTRLTAFVGSTVGAFAMAAFSFVTNYFFIYPIYGKVMGGIDKIVALYTAILPGVTELWQALVIFNVPFTFVKGLVSVVISMLIYKKLSPILKGRSSTQAGARA